MADIYVRFTAAHAIVIVTPVYWYQVPAGLKAMIDRLVCADGGNASPKAANGTSPGFEKPNARPEGPPYF